MAKALDRPLEKYAVELVNVDSVAFKPFVNLFSSEQVKTCFKKVSIITDDDRCSKKNEKDYMPRLHMNGSMDREKKHMRIQKKQHIV